MKVLFGIIFSIKCSVDPFTPLDLFGFVQMTLDHCKFVIEVFILFGDRMLNRSDFTGLSKDCKVQVEVQYFRTSNQNFPGGILA